MLISKLDIASYFPIPVNFRCRFCMQGFTANYPQEMEKKDQAFVAFSSGVTCQLLLVERNFFIEIVS
jgi:hypothetical protein